MSRPRVVPGKIRQLIELESSSLSTRELGLLLNLAQGTIVKYRGAIRMARLTWEETRQLTDHELERRVRRARAALKSETAHPLDSGRDKLRQRSVATGYGDAEFGGYLTRHNRN
jgi:hypothetical protein